MEASGLYSGQLRVNLFVRSIRHFLWVLNARMDVYFCIVDKNSVANNCISKSCLFTSHPSGGWMCE